MYFDELHRTGELSDDELDNISGGAPIHGRTTAESAAMSVTTMRES